MRSNNQLGLAATFGAGIAYVLVFLTLREHSDAIPVLVAIPVTLGAWAGGWRLAVGVACGAVVLHAGWSAIEPNAASGVSPALRWASSVLLCGYAALIGAMFDLTASLREARVMAVQRARLAQSIMDASRDALVGVGPDGTVQLCNAAALSLLGLTWREVRRRAATEVLRLGDPPAPSGEVEATTLVTTGGRRHAVETWAVEVDGLAVTFLRETGEAAPESGQAGSHS